MVEYYLSKSGESAAVDLLVETGGVGSLEKMLEGKKVDNVNRLTLYLIKTSDYIDDPERSEILGTAERLFEKEGLYNDSLRVALKRGAGEERVKELFEKVSETARSERDEMGMRYSSSSFNVDVAFISTQF